MIFGRVIGNVVATTKDEKLEGLKLLVVQHTAMDLKPLNVFSVAADGVGAGIGEYVLVVTGSSARMGTLVKNRPIDAGILAIVDIVEIEGKIIYRKEDELAGAR